MSERHNVTLSNPLKTKAIAESKVKTDKVDSLTLANLLRGGYIAESYIPPGELMQLREMVRANLVRVRSIIKNRIHAHLLMYNIKINAMGPGVHALCKCAQTEINYYELRSRNIVSCIPSSHPSAIIHAKPAKGRIYIIEHTSYGIDAAKEDGQVQGKPCKS